MEFPAVGCRNTSGSLNNPGGVGDYWSSVAGSSDDAYYLRFISSNLRVYYGGKQFGFSVRCVR
ncbi:MAG: DUF1566 domain-containing protein [Rikenellaceae bacterium]|nr:DUF1566 domain-containing protein [Rikenellaceae bacterium]